MSELIMYLKSWEKFFPDYEIKEWNEDNFDIDINKYVEEAYNSKKYAFVSDYARTWILYHEGGVYFDTDVEVIKDIREIIQHGPYLGVERFIDNIGPNLSAGLGVAAGLGMAANIGDKIIG